MSPTRVIVLGVACGGAVTVTVAEAPTARGAALTIVDGTAMVEQIGAYERGCEGSRPVTNRGGSPCVEHHFYVAPVRAAAAEAGAVQAWVTCPSSVHDAQACRRWLAGRAPRGRVLWRFRPGSDTGWARAIAASGLVSVEGAPVLLPR